ncbi:uncharacterized protein SCHCODRAFT_01221780, partial [Schizophyllum commune H4-8]|uniref:uncharacterized protein n=1 Tax=Schizophyllum commune (strain H4-8 / FGSC 9210) TaxID=578458 RepID=UPI002160FE55
MSLRYAPSPSYAPTSFGIALYHLMRNRNLCHACQALPGALCFATIDSSAYWKNVNAAVRAPHVGSHDRCSLLGPHSAVRRSVIGVQAILMSVSYTFARRDRYLATLKVYSSFPDTAVDTEQQSGTAAYSYQEILSNSSVLRLIATLRSWMIEYFLLT